MKCCAPQDEELAPLITKYAIGEALLTRTPYEARERASPAVFYPS